MDSKSMELKVMYCKDLKAFNFFQKLLVYVLVSIVSDDAEKKLKQNQQQRTPADTEGDGNPEWNHEMQFDLSDISFVDCDHLFIHFDLRHEGLYFGDKTIGEVHVPLKDLIQEKSGILRFLSYQVRSPDGKPNGVLNFSCKVIVKGNDMGIHLPTNEITGYSAVVHHDNDHHQFTEMYPTSEVGSSSPRVHYPAVELEDNCLETYPPAQGTEYSSQESHYPPPNAHYPSSLPLPPQSPPMHHPPPPPLPYGACYHPPCPPGFRPWAPSEVYYYGVNANRNMSDQQSHSFDNGEKWRTGFRGYWNRRKHCMEKGESYAYI